MTCHTCGLTCHFDTVFRPVHIFLSVASKTHTSALFYVHCIRIPHEHGVLILKTLGWFVIRVISDGMTTLWKGHKSECYWLWWNWNTHEYVFPHMSVILWQNVSGKSVYNSINCVLYHISRFSVQNHIHTRTVYWLKVGHFIYYLFWAWT